MSAAPEYAARVEERKPTSWPGLIRLSDGSELPCVVKDVSRSGAKLAVPPAFPLSKTFLLRLVGRGLAMRATVMWRRGTFVGVKIEKIVKMHNRTTEGDQDE